MQTELPDKRLSRRLLMGVTIAALAGTALLLPTDPLMANRIDLLLHPRQMQHTDFDPDAQAKFDISLGSVLPDTGAGSLIRSKTPNSKRGYLIVGLGDCASCIRFDFAQWQRDADRLRVPLIGFSSASPEHIAEFKHTLDISAPIYFDAGHKLNNQINSYWNGRVYYYDTHWRLVWRMTGLGNNLDLKHQPGLRQMIGD